MARTPFGRHRPRPRPGGWGGGLVVAISGRAIDSPVSITVTAPQGYVITAITATLAGAAVVLSGSGLTSPATRAITPAVTGALVVTATGTDDKGAPVVTTKTVTISDPHEWIIVPTAGGATVTKSPATPATPIIASVGNGSAIVA